MLERHLSGKVFGCELCSPLDGVTIELEDKDGKFLSRIRSYARGCWKIPEQVVEGTLSFRKDGYLSKKLEASKASGVIRLMEDCLIGYNHTLSCYPGDEIDCYVNCSNSFSAKLYRHGPKKQLILDLKNIPAAIQHPPDCHFVENGLGWKKNFSYQIPVNSKPGIYSLLLESEGYEAFAIPLLVGTPKKSWGSEKILVLASTNNWQTYNLWGGRSRYRNYEDGNSPGLIDKASLRSTINRNVAKLLTDNQAEFLKRMIRRGADTESWKFKKLSLFRPITNCDLESDSPFEPFYNHLAAGEWRVLAWLEKMGFRYDIVSGIGLHKHPEIVSRYPCLILSTHCEYWSRIMYEAVQNSHFSNKMWLVNLSGNTMYREVDFFEDDSIRCVSLHFSKSCADESALIGVRVTDHDYGSAAPYKVMNPNHWVFSGAPVNPKHPFFGGLSLNQYTKDNSSRYNPGRCGDANGLIGMGASGWETDKITKTAPKDIIVVAKGCNKRGGADMIIREPKENRGGLFSASSILFGGSLLIDSVSSKITENVIKRATNHHPYS